MRMKTLALVGAALILTTLANSLQAGFIGGVALEDKGIFQPVVPVKVFTSSMYIKLVSGWGPRDGEEHFRLNGERIINIPAGPPVHVYSLYPVLIEVPQPGGFANPNAPISFFDVFVGDIGDTGQIGSLPDDWVLDQAQIQDGFGNSHPGQITHIRDLNTELPASSFFDVFVDWDLSGISQTQGSFFLVEYTMTANEATAPEPATFIVWSLLGSLAIGAGWWRRKRTAA